MATHLHTHDTDLSDQEADNTLLKQGVIIGGIVVVLVILAVTGVI